MKTKSFIAMAVVMISVGVYFSACQKSEEASPSVTGNTSSSMAKVQNSLIYPTVANMFGKSYSEWGAEWWKWIFSFDCAHLPLVDHTGALQNQNQSGPVFFLGGSGGTVETRAVTVPVDKAIFLPLVNYYANYPCGSGTPAPGETVEHFLSSQVSDVLPYMDQLSLTIDGVSIPNLSAYLIQPYFFEYTGNVNLASCYDPCITGTVQQASNGGYMVMIKPLPAGPHTIHFTGGASAFSFLVDITYNITVQ